MTDEMSDKELKVQIEVLSKAVPGDSDRSRLFYLLAEQWKIFVPNFFFREDVAEILGHPITDAEWNLFRVPDSYTSDAVSQMVSDWWTAWRDDLNHTRPQSGMIGENGGALEEPERRTKGATARTLGESGEEQQANFCTWPRNPMPYRR